MAKKIRKSKGGPIPARIPSLKKDVDTKAVKKGIAYADKMAPILGGPSTVPGEFIGAKKNLTSDITQGVDVQKILLDHKKSQGYPIKPGYVGTYPGRTKHGHTTLIDLNVMEGDQAAIEGLHETYTGNDPSKKTMIFIDKKGNKVVNPDDKLMESLSRGKLKALRGSKSANRNQEQLDRIARHNKVSFVGAQKKAFGGEVEPEVASTEAKSPSLSSKLTGTAGLDPTGISKAVGVGTEMGADVINSFKSEYKYSKESPAATVRKNNALSIGAASLEGFGKLGPAGAILGAIKAFKDREDTDEAVSKWSGQNASNYASSLKASSYKNGGKIKGPGTGKSDNVKMDVPEGAFVVPAENSSTAMELGRSYLGWSKDKKASKESGEVPIMASNGEVIFSPEEVNTLRYYGVDVESLAPNAEEGSKKKVAGGFAEENPEVESVKEGEEKEEDTPKWLKNLPEMAGLLQMAGGAAGMISAGKVPDRAISNTLKKLSSETKRLSEYGYEPDQINSLNESIERSRRDYNTSVKNRGGSAMETQAALERGLIATLGEKARITFSDAAEKARKYAEHMKVEMQKAGQEYDLSNLKVSDWYKNQEAQAELFSAGISNIVGARQLKDQQRVMKEIAAIKAKIT